MKIQHKHSGSKGVFFILKGEEIVAELTYTISGEGQMIIEHTEVDEELRGDNLGYELVEKSVSYAREHHFKIIPLCTFANAIIRNKPEFSDILS